VRSRAAGAEACGGGGGGGHERGGQLAVVTATTLGVGGDPAKIVALRWAGGGGTHNCRGGVDRWQAGLAPARLLPARPTAAELAREWWVVGAVARRGLKLREDHLGGGGGGGGHTTTDVGAAAPHSDDDADADADADNNDADNNNNSHALVTKAINGRRGRRRQMLGLVVGPPEAARGPGAGWDGKVRLIWDDGRPSGGSWTQHGAPSGGVDCRELRPVWRDADGVHECVRHWCRRGAFVRHEDRDGQLCVVTEPPTEAEEESDESYAEVSRALLSSTRSILTEIYLCHACSCHKVKDGNARAGGVGDGDRARRGRSQAEAWTQSAVLGVRGRHGGAHTAGAASSPLPRPRHRLLLPR
jgi:hypothetical protein